MLRTFFELEVFMSFQLLIITVKYARPFSVFSGSSMARLAQGKFGIPQVIDAGTVSDNNLRTYLDDFLFGGMNFGKVHRGFLK